VEWSWRAGQKMHEDDPGLVSIEQDGGDGASGGGGKRARTKELLASQAPFASTATKFTILTFRSGIGRAR
jgi:hypothetical protein